MTHPANHSASHAAAVVTRLNSKTKVIDLRGWGPDDEGSTSYVEPVDVATEVVNAREWTLTVAISTTQRGRAVDSISVSRVDSRSVTVLLPVASRVGQTTHYPHVEDVLGQAIRRVMPRTKAADITRARVAKRLFNAAWGLTNGSLPRQHAGPKPGAVNARLNPSRVAAMRLEAAAENVPAQVLIRWRTAPGYERVNMPARKALELHKNGWTPRSAAHWERLVSTSPWDEDWPENVRWSGSWEISTRAAFRNAGWTATELGEFIELRHRMLEHSDDYQQGLDDLYSDFAAWATVPATHAALAFRAGLSPNEAASLIASGDWDESKITLVGALTHPKRFIVDDEQESSPKSVPVPGTSGVHVLAELDGSPEYRWPAHCWPTEMTAHQRRTLRKAGWKLNDYLPCLRHVLEHDSSQDEVEAPDALWRQFIAHTETIAKFRPEHVLAVIRACGLSHDPDWSGQWLYTLREIPTTLLTPAAKVDSMGVGYVWALAQDLRLTGEQATAWAMCGAFQLGHSGTYRSTLDRTGDTIRKWTAVYGPDAHLWALCGADLNKPPSDVIVPPDPNTLGITFPPTFASSSP